MKQLVLGIVLGFGLAWFALGAWSGGSTPGPSSPGPSAAPPPAAADASAVSSGVEARDLEPARVGGPEAAVRGPSRQRVAAPDEPFAAGECWLRIGESYTFGETVATASDAAADIRCLDIRHGVSLECPQGALEVFAPRTAIGLPERPAAAFALVRDAPTADLPKRNLWLLERTTPERTGLGFVRGADGVVYKLHLAELVGDPDALARRVRICFAAVPVRDGGGELDLPSVDGLEPIAAAVRRGIREALAIGKLVPGAERYASGLDGTYDRVTELARDTVLREPRHVVVDAVPRGGRVRLDGGGAVWLPGRLDAEARLEVGDAGGSVGVAEDVDGDVAVSGSGHVHVGGSVRGSLDLSAYASAAILGDVHGTLKVRSYVDVYIRGQVFGAVDTRGSCWSTLYLQSFHSKVMLEQMRKGPFGQLTVHVRTSDLPVGEYEDVGSWRRVIVGAPVWETLAR